MADTWTIQLDRLEVVDADEDGAFSDGDEPYLVAIGFRSTPLKRGSTHVTWSGTLDEDWAAGTDSGEGADIPPAMGRVTLEHVDRVTADAVVAGLPTNPAATVGHGNEDSPRAGRGREAGMGRLLSVWALVAVAVMAVATPVLGASPVSHDRFSDTFTETDFCGSGLTVVHTVRGVENIIEGDDSFKATGHFRDVVTNPDNGKSVIVSGAGLFTNTTISGDPEHVHTQLFTSKGLPSKVQTAHGGVLFRDAGFIAFAVTFDGDTFISVETAINKGPHPEADSDFTLFCDTVVPALS